MCVLTPNVHASASSLLGNISGLVPFFFIPASTGPELQGRLLSAQNAGSGSLRTLGKGSFTRVNVRGRLDCAIFFLLPRVVASRSPAMRAVQCAAVTIEVVESLCQLWPGRPRLWPHCGYSCSTGVSCAVRKRAKVRVTPHTRSVSCELGAHRHLCMGPRYIERQCANVSQMR